MSSSGFVSDIISPFTRLWVLICYGIYCVDSCLIFLMAVIVVKSFF